MLPFMTFDTQGSFVLYSPPSKASSAISQASMQFVKELAIRRAQQMAQSLMENYSYLGTLKKQIADAVGESTNMSLAISKKPGNS